MNLCSRWKNVINQILCGDSEKILETLPDQAIDLIFTSPPYAQQRQQQYASDNDFIQGSARLQGCFKILDEIYQKREKALIFIDQTIT